MPSLLRAIAGAPWRPLERAYRLMDTVSEPPQGTEFFDPPRLDGMAGAVYRLLRDTDRAAPLLVQALDVATVRWSGQSSHGPAHFGRGWAGPIRKRSPISMRGCGRSRPSPTLTAGGDVTRWRVHGSRQVYASEWLNVDLDVVEIPGGARFEHHVIRFPRASVGAVVVDDADRVLLLWRHRFTTDAWGWEIPAGWSEIGEDPVEAVRREVAEETGYRPGRMEPMATYSPMTGISAHRYRLFLTRGVVRVGDPDIAESERVEWVSVGKVPESAAQGLIPDGPSLTALTYYLTVTRRT